MIPKVTGSTLAWSGVADIPLPTKTFEAELRIIVNDDFLGNAKPTNDMLPYKSNNLSLPNVY